MHFQNLAQGHISEQKHFKLGKFSPYGEYNIFNTDIDPGCASIEASPGPGFRKPSPGSSHDSSYV